MGLSASSLTGLNNTGFFADAGNRSSFLKGLISLDKDNGKADGSIFKNSFKDDSKLMDSYNGAINGDENAEKAFFDELIKKAKETKNSETVIEPEKQNTVKTDMSNLKNMFNNFFNEQSLKVKDVNSINDIALQSTLDFMDNGAVDSSFDGIYTQLKQDFINSHPAQAQDKVSKTDNDYTQSKASNDDGFNTNPVSSSQSSRVKGGNNARNLAEEDYSSVGNEKIDIKDFDDMLKFVLKWEGGYSDDADDSGGATKWGITHAAYESYMNDKNADVRNMTKDQMKEIYKNNYYIASGADKIEDKKLALAVFDTAVNMGVGRAKQLLKQSDGDFNKFMNLRKDKYREFASHGNQGKFLAGWLNRANDLEKNAQAMA